MKPAKNLHLPASVMPATPCLVKDNLHSQSLFCLNYCVITFSSWFGELLQKTELSFSNVSRFTFWRHTQAWQENSFGRFIMPRSQSILSKTLSLPAEVHSVSFLMASLIDFYLYTADKDTRVYRQMFNIFLTIHSRLPREWGGKTSIYW